MESKGSFSPNSARRAANKAATQLLQKRDAVWKPSALDPEEIINAYPHVFQAGKHALPAGRSVWNLPKLLDCHGKVCDRCRLLCVARPGFVPVGPHPDCYFAKLWLIFINGWSPAKNQAQEAHLRGRMVTRMFTSQSRGRGYEVIIASEYFGSSVDGATVYENPSAPFSCVHKHCFNKIWRSMALN